MPESRSLAPTDYELLHDEECAIYQASLTLDKTNQRWPTAAGTTSSSLKSEETANFLGGEAMVS